MTYKQALKLIDSNMEELAQYAQRYGKIINDDNYEINNAYMRVKTLAVDGFQVETIQSNGKLLEVALQKKIGLIY